MSISLRTHKMLWGRSGNRCAFAECRRLLVEDDSLTDDPSLVGDEAHIVAREVEGPRGISPLTSDERDKYDNLVLLCKIHHKKIDDQPLKYPVDYLQTLKAEHLKWVEDALGPNDKKQKDDELYAAYIDKWIELANIKNWKAWTSWMLGGGEPTIDKSIYDQFRSLNEYLLNRVWPRRYEMLELAFHNFRIVLNDFLKVFDKYRIEIGGEDDPSYIVEKIYKRLEEWNPEEWNRLYEIFDFHVYLVEDLVCELTRAANFICDQIRVFISSSFRLEEGILLVESGPDYNFGYKIIRLVYPPIEKSELPYRGLQNFMVDRENYYHFGTGVTDRYLPFNPENP